MTTSQRRIRDHELVLHLYRNCDKLADLLESAGNVSGAEDVRTMCREVASEHVLDRILKPEESK